MRANGAVTTAGDARFYGGASGLALNGPIVGGAVVAAGTGAPGADVLVLLRATTPL